MHVGLPLYEQRIYASTTAGCEKRALSAAAAQVLTTEGNGQAVQPQRRLVLRQGQRPRPTLPLLLPELGGPVGVRARASARKRGPQQSMQHVCCSRACNRDLSYASGTSLGLLTRGMLGADRVLARCVTAGPVAFGGVRLWGWTTSALPGSATRGGERA